MYFGELRGETCKLFRVSGGGATVGSMTAGMGGVTVSVASCQTSVIHGNAPACGGIIIYLVGVSGGWPG